MKVQNLTIRATAICMMLFAAANPASAEVIYFADATGAVGAYDDQTTLVNVVGDVSDSFAVSQSIGIAYDATNARILLLDRNAPMVYEMNPATGDVAQLFNPGISFQGGAVKGAVLYGINEGTQTMVAFDLNTFTPITLSGATALPEHGHGVGINAVTGQLYIGTYSDVIYEVADDGTPGALVESTDTGIEDLDPYNGGFLYVGYGREVIQIDSGSNESVFLTDPQITSAGVTGSLSGVVVSSDDNPQPVADTARFNVTKTFTDLSEDEVEVTLTCNGGLPLEQSFTIAGGDLAGVTFVVTNVGAGVDCEVTESGGPSGYLPVMNDGDGCAWTDVTGGLSTCAIENQALPATFTVYKEWIISENGGGDDVDRIAEIVITCNMPILNGDEQPGDLRVAVPLNGYDEYTKTGTIIGDGELEAIVDTSTGSAMCSAEEVLEQSSVDSSDDCGTRTIDAGDESECTITNTVFFEGIPSLNQYGLAIMALLMLGVGMVGFRRFA